MRHEAIPQTLALMGNTIKFVATSFLHDKCLFEPILNSHELFDFHAALLHPQQWANYISMLRRNRPDRSGQSSCMM